METLTLYHNNPNVKTLEEFCRVSRVYLDTKDSEKKNKYTLDDFFEDNRQKIFSQMSMLDRIEFIKQYYLGHRVEDLTADDLNIDMTLPCPLQLIIPKKYVTYMIAARHTNLQQYVSDITAFEDAQIRSAIREDAIRFMARSDVKRLECKCSVVGFFKTLYYNRLKSTNGQAGVSDGIYQTRSNFTDISDFILSLNTNATEQGSTFSFALPHVPLYHTWDSNDERWGDPKSANRNKDISAQVDIDAIREEIFKIAGDDNDYPVVKSAIDSMDYFNWLIAPNDLIFISFDEIDKESIRDSDMALNSFDMIGLVDNVTLSRDSQGNITVNVSGKDLIKLLQDDSSIYFPNASVTDKGNFFDNVEGALRTGDLSGIGTINGQTADKVVSKDEFMRMPSTGSIRLFYEEANGFSIDYIIKVVIGALTNLQICPSEIFQSWGERRTKFSYFTPNDSKKNV